MCLGVAWLEEDHGRLAVTMYWFLSVCSSFCIFSMAASIEHAPIYYVLAHNTPLYIILPWHAKRKQTEKKATMHHTKIDAFDSKNTAFVPIDLQSTVVQ